MRTTLKSLAIVVGILSVLLLIAMVATAAPGAPVGPDVAQPTPTEVVFQQGADGYTGSETAYIDYFNPSTSFCRSQYLLVSGSPSRSALVRFDVHTIPSNATILEAYLETYADPESGVSPLEVGTFGMLKDWTACEATWANASAGVAWQTPGASGLTDRTILPSDKETLQGSGWYYFSVTKWVQNWVLNASVNQGVVLSSVDPRYGQIYKFISNQHSATDLHPRLRVKYVVTGVAPSPVPVQQILPTGVMTFQQGLGGYTGCDDTYIDSNMPSTNFNRGQLLLVRGRVNTSSLLRFGIAALPPEIQVLEAYLHVNAMDESAVQPLQVASHAVLRPWEDDQATWLNATTGQAWEEAGCTGLTDRSTLPSDRELLHGMGWWQFNVTDIVKEWVEQRSANSGFLLESPDESSAALYKLVSTHHTDTTAYPVLIVSYAPLPPTPTPTPTSPTQPTATPMSWHRHVFLPAIFKAH